jgi:O-methyltransferase
LGLAIFDDNRQNGGAQTGVVMNYPHLQKNDLAERYLDLMAKTLCRFDGVDDFRPARFGNGSNPIRKLIGKAVLADIDKKGFEIVKRIPFDREKRMNGRDIPNHADTMIGMKRLQNVRDAVRIVIEEGIPGDIVETGVWRGGASIMMRATLEAYCDQARTIWCCDSFEGLPPPEMDRYPQDAGMDWHTNPALGVSMEQVKANFARYGFQDERVQFLKGWFKDTLPAAPFSKIAILRLDGDLYASTMDALNPCYDKVVPGGFIIVDDYGIPQDVCRRAVEDFRASRGITDPIIDIDGWGKYWRKSA